MENPTKSKSCDNCARPSEELHELPSTHFRKNHLGILDDDHLIGVCVVCRDQSHGRAEALNKILNSESTKKLIVSGPGTGKTFTFKKVLEQSDPGKAIAFTLIRNLAQDLKSELADVKKVNVNTFHGYCKALLHGFDHGEGITTDFEFFPKLPVLIEADSVILGLDHSENRFSESIVNLETESESFGFYFERANYYNASSFNDSVFRVYNSWKTYPQRIKSYSVVIADEYQDFNLLEASFIDLLSTRNSILLAGDDDQMLYPFRHASNEFIRRNAADEEFDVFELPYCSRCTPAIVECAKHFIAESEKRGLLEGRIEKAFESYWPDKFHENELFPKVKVADCTSEKTTQAYILDTIQSISEGNENELKASKDLPFLVVGPSSGYSQENVAKYLKENLDMELFHVIKKEKRDNEIDIKLGYQMIINANNKNLGWRIVLFNDHIDNMIEILSNTEQSIEDQLPQDYKDKHLEVIAEWETEEESVDLEVEEKEINEEKINILVTNYLGSKGLSAKHTFLIGLRNGEFPRDPDNIDETEVFQFFVGLTRSKHSSHLLTNKFFDQKKKYSVKDPSVFFEMLPREEIEVVKCSLKNGKVVSV